MIYAYKSNNADFSHIGDTSLIPTEAYTESELNGSWTARLVHPIDPEGRWKFIEPGGVIKMPSWNGDQLYRIVNRVKENDYITCEMYPIFFDSMNDLFLLDVSITNKTGQQALTAMLQGSQKYSAITDISSKKSAKYQCKNFLEALTGDDENVFVKTWGGELEFDNFTVKVNSVLGTDNGLTLRYGTNIHGVQEDIDTSAILTRVYPQAFNGRPMSSPGYIDSPLIASYPTVKIGVMQFEHIKAYGDATEEDDNDPSIIVCRSQAEMDAALTDAVNAAFDNGLDKPTINITVSGVVDLSRVRRFAGLVNPIGLGDVAHLYNPIIGIETDTRVVYIKYDSIRERAEDIQIGSKPYNYFQSVSESQVQASAAYTMADSGLSKAINLESLITGGENGRFLVAKGFGNEPEWEEFSAGAAEYNTLGTGQFTPPSAGSWLYTGISFRTAKRQLAFLHSNGSAAGLGLSTTDSQIPPNIYCHQEDDVRRTSIFFLPAGTYYLFLKANVANSPRTLSAFGIEIRS